MRRLDNFKARLLSSGYVVIMYSGDNGPKYELKMALAKDGATITLDGSYSGVNERLFSVPVSTCAIRRATDPDPDFPQFAGSRILRDSIKPQEAMKAFIVTSVDAGKGARAEYNLVAATEYECAEIVEGLILLVVGPRQNAEMSM